MKPALPSFRNPLAALLLTAAIAFLVAYLSVSFGFVTQAKADGFSRGKPGSSNFIEGALAKKPAQEADATTYIAPSQGVARIDNEDNSFSCESDCCGATCIAATFDEHFAIQHVMGTGLAVRLPQDGQLDGADPAGLMRPPNAQATI